MNRDTTDFHLWLCIFFTALVVIQLHPLQNLIPNCPDTITKSGIPTIAKKTVNTLAPAVDGATFP